MFSFLDKKFLVNPCTGVYTYILGGGAMETEPSWINTTMNPWGWGLRGGIQLTTEAEPPPHIKIPVYAPVGMIQCMFSDAGLKLIKY